MTGLHTAQSRLLMVAVVAVSLNLRPAIAAIGPLTGLILDTTGMGSTGIGLLTMLPVFLMGVGAMSVRLLRKALGEKFGIGCGAFILAAACVSRVWFDGGIGLLATAAGAGVGISIVQALAPSFIKRNFAENTGRAIGLFSTGIVSGAAIAAASAAGLADRFGWAPALALWAVPALLALAIWSVASRAAASEAPASSLPVETPAFWRNPRSWSLLVFFGIGTGAFMLVMAWLPPFYVERGQSPQTAGYLLAGLTFVEALTALGLAAFIHHFPDRRGPLVTCLVLVLAGLACLLIEPLMLAVPAVLLLGAGIGILFPLSIIVAIDHVRNPTIAGDFTAFVQGGGYIIASLVPLMAGALRDVFADLSQAWMLMAIGIVGLILLALRYSPESYRTFRQSLLS
ncbi:MAG TPA: MFS transporter [Pararhizobium sp.]|uniref:MFS transporter n=1 Tax=Pararhizobium sp. TaxID=1977563 RepID=UPI002B6AA12A|nr:MFS transporter [Pararhizobium sp.]HTO32243.1 MFS transporter [Pararhizobium sp.]